MPLVIMILLFLVNVLHAEIDPSIKDELLNLNGKWNGIEHRLFILDRHFNQQNRADLMEIIKQTNIELGLAHWNDMEESHVQKAREQIVHDLEILLDVLANGGEKQEIQQPLASVAESVRKLMRVTDSFSVLRNKNYMGPLIERLTFD